MCFPGSNLGPQAYKVNAPPLCPLPSPQLTLTFWASAFKRVNLKQGHFTPPVTARSELAAFVGSPWCWHQPHGTCARALLPVFGLLNSIHGSPPRNIQLKCLSGTRRCPSGSLSSFIFLVPPVPAGGLRAVLAKASEHSRGRSCNSGAPPPFAASKQLGPLLPLKLALVTRVGLGEVSQTPGSCRFKFL